MPHIHKILYGIAIVIVSAALSWYIEIWGFFWVILVLILAYAYSTFAYTIGYKVGYDEGKREAKPALKTKYSKKR